MPATLTTSAKACLNMVEPLERIIGSNSPDQIRENIAVIAALKSPQNTAGLKEPKVIGKNGKKLRVEYTYNLPDNTAPATEYQTLCDLNANEKGDPSRTVTFDGLQYRSKGGKITYETYRELCSNPSETQAFEIKDAAYNILRDVATDLYTRMYASGGTYKDGTSSAVSPRTLNILTNEGKASLPIFAGIKRYFDKHGNTPLLIGGNDLATVRDVIKLSNKDGGVPYDPAMMLANMPIWTDHKIDETINSIPDPAINDSHILAFTKGAFRLIEAYHNVGIYNISTETVTHTTIEIFGVTFDFSLSFDAKCREVTWLLSKSYELFTLPQLAYASGENYVSKLNFKAGVGNFDYAQIKP